MVEPPETAGVELAQGFNRSRRRAVWDTGQRLLRRLDDDELREPGRAHNTLNHPRTSIHPLVAHTSLEGFKWFLAQKGDEKRAVIELPVTTLALTSGLV